MIEMSKGKENYEYGYGRLFNILFHVGVIFNVCLVIWLYLVFFGII